MPNRTLDDMYEKMPWDRIDSVVFDVGGVLIDLAPMEVFRQLLPGQEALYKELLYRTERSPYWIMLDDGALSQEEAVEAMTGRNEALRPLIRAFMAHWPEYTTPVAEGVEAARTCKAHGKKLYILSNFPDEQFAHVERLYDFFQLFDGKVVSARVRMLKPNPAIYRLLIDRYQLDPERTVFIDDMHANIEAALRAGWQGFCMNRPGRLRAFLQE